jgi:hypothetical protein
MEREWKTLEYKQGPTTDMAVFSSFEVPKILQDIPSHQIFERMHEALNIGKKITNYTVWL